MGFLKRKKAPMAQQPLNPGDITIGKEKMAAFAPPREIAPLPEGPQPGGLNIPRDNFAAYIPPPEGGQAATTGDDQVAVRLLPIGGCQHPIAARWAPGPDSETEGCTLCGLAQVFRPGDGLSWEQDDDWTLAARKAGVIPPG